MAHYPALKRILIAILRLFFKLLYHQFAWTYDRVAALVSLGSWNRWVETTLTHLDGPSVLEVGFGPGHLQVCLHQKGIMAVGVDESWQMSKLTHLRLSKQGLVPTLVRGDAYFLPFANQSFDQVVMTFPAEFLLQRATFVEINRLLRPGGLLLILPMAWVTGKRPLERLIAWINHIAGQAPPWDEKYLKPLKDIGFTTHWEIIEFTSSKVLLLRLYKQIQQ
jgi:ubiquinone/menaquinone biosynthesis C-methylase UbiE